MRNNKPLVIDLFCGCGGLSYGLSKAGYKIVLGIDNWKESLETFAINHEDADTLEADLSNLPPSEVADKFEFRPGKISVIVGGPPCQGFSISGKRIIDDPRNKMYKSFVLFVKYFKPKAFLLENVPNLISLGNGFIKNQIIEDFEALGYKVVYKVVLASNYGVPQNRRRVIFVGLLGGEQFDFPEPTHGEEMFSKPFVSSKEAIGDLPEDTVKDGQAYIVEAQSEYQKEMRKGSRGIYNHEVIVHSDKTKKIISMVPDGGNYKNLPAELQRTRKVHIAWTRLNSNKPSFTIDTGHNHHFHYVYNRVPTARESARIQSFPDTFIFRGNKASQLKQVGNAVPPLLAYSLGKKLLYYVDKN